MLNRLFHLKCPECGERIDEEDRYCPHCGTNLDAPLERLEVDKEKSREYLEKAQFGYDQGSNLKDALEYCELAIQYDPASTASHNLHGLILDALGQTENAIDAYEEALRIDPSYEDAKANLTDAKLELQQDTIDAERKKKTLLTVVLSFVGIASLVCILAGAVAFYKVLSPYIGPKATIIIEPDYSLLSKVDPSELENAAQILRDRSRSFGYENVSFEVLENGQIIGKVPTSVDVETFTKRILAIGLLEFVDFGATSIPSGTIVATDFDSAFLKQPDKTKWHTVMTNAEIAEASLSMDVTQKPAVSFLLTSQGAEILLDYTTKNVGKYLGIVLDKVVISSPVVNQPITDGQGIIQGGFSEGEAENLAAYLSIDPLPIPLIVKEIKQ